MNFIERLKLLGYKEFWSGCFSGVKGSINTNKELLKKKRYFQVILNVLLIPLVFILIIGLVIFDSEAVLVLSDEINKRKLKNK